MPRLAASASNSSWFRFDPRSLTRGCAFFGPCAVSPAKAPDFRTAPRPGHPIGHPSGPTATVLRWPNCSAVRLAWHSAQRQRMLLSSSDPPWTSGKMWSGTVASRTIPARVQSRQRGSERRRRSRWATAARPRRRVMLVRLRYVRTSIHYQRSLH